MLNLLIQAGLCRFTDQPTACFCGHFHALVHRGGIDHSYFLMHILSWRLEVDRQSLQQSTTNNAQALSGQVNPIISIARNVNAVLLIRRTQRDCAGLPTANVMMAHHVAFVLTSSC